MWKAIITSLVAITIIIILVCVICVCMLAKTADERGHVRGFEDEVV